MFFSNPQILKNIKHICTVALQKKKWTQLRLQYLYSLYFQSLSSHSAFFCTQTFMEHLKIQVLVPLITTSAESLSTVTHFIEHISPKVLDRLNVHRILTSL